MEIAFLQNCCLREYFDNYDGHLPLRVSPCTVRVFKCSQMASTCGRCRSVELQYGCGWCGATKACSVRSQCKEGTWLDREQMCPDPVINVVRKIVSVHKSSLMTTRRVNTRVCVCDYVM